MKVKKFFSLMESNNSCKVYWKLRLKKPWMTVGLRNIGCPDNKYDFLYAYSNDFDYSLIDCNNYPSSNKVDWSWNGNAQILGSWEWYNSRNYFYMGEVPITEDELADFDLKYDALKYNL